jgi:outer membrane protein assembly factor BamB
MRWRLAVLGVAVMLVSAACGPVDWLMFRFEPDHSSFTPDTSISKTAVQSSMVLDWKALTGGVVAASPAVANGILYISPDNNAKLEAFDAAGNTNCSGSPKTCSPLWTGTVGPDVKSSPAVANGVVYLGASDHKLYAFDAAGNTNCSGSPKTCSPLWTATTGNFVYSSPTVSNGVVYVGSDDGKLYAFDAAGSTNCSGTPKTCNPLWTASTGAGVETSPAVANGIVYVGSNQLYAFDAAGNTNCSGSPKACSPLWTAPLGSGGTPAVANGVVYVGSTQNHSLYAFDAVGNTNCSGTPKTCSPLWYGFLGYYVNNSTDAPPAVANGVVYVGSRDSNLYAFDAAGSTNCSGSPTKTCTPLWTGATAGSIILSSPAVANGVVYIGSSDDKLYAFDAAGSVNCSGAPKTCSPLWKAATTGYIESSPVVENRVVYIGSGDSSLYAFGLENIPPTTSVVIPSNGATVSGTTLLDASASDDVSVSRVEFHLTGGSYHDTLIGVATPTQYGWIYHWDSTSVPNGAYTLNSVATDPAGNVGHSAGVSINVAN